MLNANVYKKNDVRGSDAAQNDWMYNTSKFVLENIKPKVFWGENAPGLFTEMGKGVRNKLYEIGKKNGYSFSVIKTSTDLHGIPQRRPRSFYFFWKGKRAPLLNWYKSTTPTLEDYLDMIPDDATYHLDLGENHKFTSHTGPLKDNIYYRWWKHKEFKLSDCEKDNFTILGFIGTNRILLDDLQLFVEQNGNDKEIKNMQYIMDKYADGKGVWDSSPYFFKESVNSVISKNMSNSVHPSKERFMTIREYMWLMGLPNEFQLHEDRIDAKFTQNVPISTAKDMTAEVIKFINGELKMSNSDYILQNNFSQKIEFEKSLVQAVI